MKKVILIIALSITALMATGQNKIDTTGMSDYEKYYYTKTGDIDTTVKASSVENDDLYYIAPKDDKQVITIFNRQKKAATPAEAQLYTAGYSDGYEEGVEDVTEYLYDDYYYASRIYRFHSGFSFGYYSPYWSFSYGHYNPFWYDPWYYDPWYYPYSYWGYPYYPYYGGGYYPYYPYYGGGYYVNPVPANKGYGMMGGRYYTYTSPSPNKIMNNPKYNYNSIGTKSYNTGARTISSSLSNDMRVNAVTRRTSPSTVSKSSTVGTQMRTNTTTQSKSAAQPQAQTRTIEKSMYNQSNRTYTPSYTTPKMSTRPTYNNTQQHQMDRTSTQFRTYSTPNKSSTPSRSSSYSTPSRSSYSTPSRSTYSTPSRSTYSTPSGSSSSYSGGGMGKSSGNSSSGHSSGGRR